MSDESRGPDEVAATLRAEWAALTPVAKRRIRRAVFSGARLRDPATLPLALVYAETFIARVRWFVVGALVVGLTGIALSVFDGEVIWTAVLMLALGVSLVGLMAGAARFRRVNQPARDDDPRDPSSVQSFHGRRRVRFAEGLDPLTVAAGTIGLAVLAVASDTSAPRVGYGGLAVVSAVLFVVATRARRGRRRSASLGARGLSTPTRRRRE